MEGPGFIVLLRSFVMMDEYDLYVPSMYGVGFDYYLGSMG